MHSALLTLRSGDRTPRQQALFSARDEMVKAQRAQCQNDDAGQYGVHIQRALRLLN
jgi:hypothetical protein